MPAPPLAMAWVLKPGIDDEWDERDEDEESLFGTSPPKQPAKKAKTTSSRPDLPLFNATWDTRFEAMKALKAQATQIHKRSLLQVKPSSNKVHVHVRCRTAVKNGKLKPVPDGELQCPYHAVLNVNQPHGAKAAYWRLTDDSILEHRNCSGTAKPSAGILMSLASSISSVHANKGVPAAELQKQWIARDGVAVSRSTAYRVRDALAAKMSGDLKDFEKISAWLEDLKHA